MFKQSPGNLSYFLSAVAACSAITETLGQEDFGVAMQSVMLIGLDFSRDGSILAVGGDRVRVYDVNTGTLSAQFSPPGLTYSVLFSPTDPDCFATAGMDGAIRIWELSKVEPIRVIAVHSGLSHAIAFSPDGSLIASCGQQRAQGDKTIGELKVVETDTGETAHSLSFPDGDATAVTFSGDGKLFAFCKTTVTGNGVASQIDVYELRTWQIVTTIPFAPGSARSISFLPGDRNILIAGAEQVPLGPNSTTEKGKLWLASLDKDLPARLIDTPGYPSFRSAEPTPNGEHFATGTATFQHRLDSRGKAVLSWVAPLVQMRESVNGEVLWSIEGKGEIGETQGVQVSPDGRFVACCFDKSVLILDAKSGNRIRSIKAEE